MVDDGLPMPPGTSYITVKYGSCEVPLVSESLKKAVLEALVATAELMTSCPSKTPMQVIAVVAEQAEAAPFLAIQVKPEAFKVQTL